ncbi:zinc-dependent metalloprotease [Pedobacter sp. 22226]|uniref:zinc-dependent metalloprotease n=1 Tax=Pedobacter sp. 22226 TaxID=3453894 RepID=UPI003F86CEFD
MFNQKSILFSTAISLTAIVSGCALFHKKPVPAKVVAVDPAKKTADSLKKATGLKPYSEVITKGTQTKVGFFTVHQKDEKYYFEVPNKILNRDILIVSRISKASADMRNGSSGYAGDQLGETVFRFEKGPNKKLFLRRISFSEFAKDSTTTMFASLQKNNVSAIVASFPVLAMPKDSSAVVVDVTDFLNADNDVLYFQKKVFKDKAGMAGQQNDKSYVDYIHTYARNIEIGAVKTYSAGLNPTGSSYTVNINSSLVLLDLKPMRARLEDPRVGYFSTSFRDFDVDPQGVKTTTYIKRWKLEPKPEDVEKYKRGELVEPAKQIVYYIDPVTPKKWVPYLMAGVNDWQKAFEAAGFKNAIIAKEAPTKAQDSTWSIDDASHSAIIYRPSAIANAMGPSISDPRSGEIIESHIFWYHNVMALLQKWYRTQASAVDPRARKAEFDDELMGNLIRFVSSHEVGHTLGLLHNFGSSSTVPVEKLRDKAWVEANGHTPSIMDYARFNYVAQPEDNISEKGIFPRIGDYDKWAIKWAYTWHPEYSSAEEEHRALVKVVSDSLKSNHRLWFGYEGEAFDPRSQNEDLGDNAVLASAYGIKNLKRIMPQIDKWVSVPGEDQSKLFAAYSGIWDQFELYIGHVTKNVAGEYHTPKVNGESGMVIESAPAWKQKDAVKFLNDNVFATPMWLNNTSITNKLSINFGVELNAMQQTSIDALITRNRLSRMLTSEMKAKGKAYTINELFSDLDQGIFKELYNGQNVDIYRRNMQKLYVWRLMVQGFYNMDMSTINPPSTFRFTVTDLNAIIRAELRKQQALFKTALTKPGLNNINKLHLKEMIFMIDSKFNAERSGLAR